MVNYPWDDRLEKNDKMPSMLKGMRPLGNLNGNILLRISFDFLAAQQLRRVMQLSALTMLSSGLLFILPGNLLESAFHL